MENVNEFCERFIDDMNQVVIDQKDEFEENFWKGVNFTIEMLKSRLEK